MDWKSKLPHLTLDQLDLLVKEMNRRGVTSEEDWEPVCQELFRRRDAASRKENLDISQER